MGSVVGLLNENLTEMLKSLYKLRKAYMTLNGLAEAELKYMNGKPGGMSATGNTSQASGFNSYEDNKQVVRPVLVVSAPSDRGQEKSKKDLNDDGDDDDQFFDAEEASQGMASLKIDDKSGDTQSDKKSLSSNLTVGDDQRENGLSKTTTNMSSSSTYFSHPIDVFVHSGVGLCFGMLLVMISMIPPAFGKVLAMIGFRGDREQGIKMLWEASKYSNINGAMAGLCLLTYYNGILGFCDIMSDDTEESVAGYPARRCEELLAQMRSRYPRSRLWSLEEARMHAVNRDIDSALKILSGDISTPLKQIEALAMFEKSLNSIYVHNFDMATESFVKVWYFPIIGGDDQEEETNLAVYGSRQCVDLNSWSHALYFYVAGSSQVELYRECKLLNDDTKAVSAPVIRRHSSYHF